MSHGIWRAPFRLSIARMLVGALVCAGLTACAAAGPKPVAPADTLVFPDPEMATIKGGIFVGADQLGQVADGMSKPQVYAALGVSHFSEGMSSSAREWNYLFNFRDSGDQVQQCQFMLQFDENDRVVATHWKPVSCEARLHTDAPTPPPMATWTKPAPAGVPAPPAVIPATAGTEGGAPDMAAPVPPTTLAATKAPAAPSAAPVPVKTAPQALAPVCPAVPAQPVATATPAPTPAPASATPAPAPASATATPASAPAPVSPPVATSVPASTPAPVAVTPSAPVPLAPLSLSSDAAFSSGSSKLSPAGRERLDSMLLQVQFPTELHAIHIVGYSDRIGTKRGNLRLSHQRAEAVRKYLIEGGVPADQVTAEGRGEADPQVQCSEKGKKALAACLAPNRRVEITGMAAKSSP